MGLAARIATPAALIVAWTVAAFGQSTFDFIKSTDPLFAGVLTQPANLSNTIQYAVTAASQGDIESAISAYEQLRFYNPKLAATRFQLGVLYYQLGSYAQARGYLQTALAMPDLTPELRQKIEDLLEIVDKKLQPDQFYGFAQTGLRYQTKCQSRRRSADRSSLGSDHQQQFSRAAGLELVWHSRGKLHPRFRNSDRRDFRSFGDRLRRAAI